MRHCQTQFPIFCVLVLVPWCAGGIFQSLANSWICEGEVEAPNSAASKVLEFSLHRRLSSKYPAGDLHNAPTPAHDATALGPCPLITQVVTALATSCSPTESLA